ncbi:hypothetical protein [Streptomyces sp. NPDC046939]|uniref:STAS domain-containing protein n=1 Tax=Streptomyces sp. NPDC046939 TaxID=3155376 RepID=UPI00340E4450
MERARVTFPARWATGNVLVVDVAGTFDDAVAAELCGLLGRMTDTGQRLFVLDFRGVEHCTTGAVRQFVGTALGTEGAPDAGSVALVAHAAARSALRAAGADRLRGGIHATLTDAIKACHPSTPEELGEPAP